MATKKKEELASPLTGVSESTAQKLAEYQAGYQQGENVTNAYNEYNTLKQNAPQAYVSPYQTQLDDLYAKITNRGPFKYNLNGDMLYQNAKEQYQQLGKQAMVDTIGQATQLTGGYGNSYAQNVGNQAYQQWLTKLNEKIPEYYNLAMQRYNMEGDELNNQYGLLRDRENEAYGRYRDTVSDYNQNLQMAYNVYNNERDNDYGAYRDALAYWMDQAGAENKDYWTQAQFDYQKEQDALNLAWQKEQFDREMAYRYAALAQSRANAAAREAEQEAKKREQEEKEKQERLAASGANTVMVSNGLNGLVKTTATLPGLVPALQNILSNVTETPKAAKPTLDLGGYGGPSADLSKMIEKADSYQSKYNDEASFLLALTDTVKWYQQSGNLSDYQAYQILRHYNPNLEWKK